MHNKEKSDSLHSKLIDLELAKINNKNSKVRRYLPAFVFVATSYYSLLLSTGMIMGYLGSKIFTKLFLDNGKISSVYINCGKYRIHLHHWITGSVLLLSVWVVDFLYLPMLFVGVLLGIIAHDIYDFNDWHKVIVKKEIKE